MLLFSVPGPDDLNRMVLCAKNFAQSSCKNFKRCRRRLLNKYVAIFSVFKCV